IEVVLSGHIQSSVVFNNSHSLKSFKDSMANPHQSIADSDLCFKVALLAQWIAYTGSPLTLVLGIELRDFCLFGKHSITELQPQRSYSLNLEYPSKVYVLKDLIQGRWDGSADKILCHAT
ncbi:hypothetical protein STEG23_004003, partial [Scotinomys teguina]